jgi:hypothetical protein
MCCLKRSLCTVHCVVVVPLAAPYFSSDSKPIRQMLQKCVKSVLTLALDSGIAVVAICGLGAGAFKWDPGASLRPPVRRRTRDPVRATPSALFVCATIPTCSPCPYPTPHPHPVPHSTAVATREIVWALVSWSCTLLPSLPPIKVVLFDFNPAVTAGFAAAVREFGPRQSTRVHPPLAPSPTPPLPPLPPAPRVPTHQWWWNGPETPAIPGKFVRYSNDQNEQLEQALAAGAPSVVLAADKLAPATGNLFTADLSRMVQVSQKYKTERGLKRTALGPGEFPPLYKEAVEAHKVRAEARVTAWPATSRGRKVPGRVLPV